MTVEYQGIICNIHGTILFATTEQVVLSSVPIWFGIESLLSGVGHTTLHSRFCMAT